jgi:hypothetical protein
MDFNRLKEVAIVLNTKFGLNPKIKLGGVTEQDLVDQITEAIEDGIWKYYEKQYPDEPITEELVKDDAELLGKETVQVLKEMKIWPGSTTVDNNANEEIEEEEEGAEEQAETRAEEDDEPIIDLEETEIVVEHFEDEEGVVLDDEEDEDVPELPDFEGLLKTVKSASKLPLTERTTLFKKLIKDNPHAFTPVVKDMIKSRFSVDDLQVEMLDVLEKAVAKQKPKEGGEVKEKQKKDGKENKIEKPSTAASKIDKRKRIPINKKEKYSRIDAICEALMAEPKTIQEWYEETNRLMREHELKENNTENVFLIRFVRKMEKHFDFGVKMPKV